MFWQNRTRGAAVTVAALAMIIAGDCEAKLPVEGMPAPSFSGATFDGKKISLDDFRGKVLIINFWATWCAPCRRELPLLDTYVRQREENGLRVVAVTLDANLIRAGFLKQLQEALSLPLLKDFNGDYAPIRRAVPTNFVVDRAGIVRYAKADAFTLDELNTLLVPLLNEAPPADSAPAPTAQ